MDTSFSLHINGVEQSDQGDYACHASNSEGDAMTTTRLVVQRKYM